MKAIIQKKYGGPEMLEIANVEIPTYKDNEVLIEVCAVNIASGDMRVNTLDVPIILKPIIALVFGFKGPRRQIRGLTASGIIKEIGSKVTKYKVGQRVYFINSMKAGCLAEFISIPDKSVMAEIPRNMSFIEAAPVTFGAMSAYHFINSKNIKPGDDVLIYGASGSVGSYGLQLAKFYGANVTAVCSKKNHEKMIDLGADYVIDYKSTDFRDGPKKYDVIFDAVLKISKKSSKKVLKKNGKYLSIMFPTKEDRSRLLVLNEIISKGKLVTLIDTVFSFDEYKEAHKLTYSGHKVGNVIINMK